MLIQISSKGKRYLKTKEDRQLGSSYLFHLDILLLNFVDFDTKFYPEHVYNDEDNLVEHHEDSGWDGKSALRRLFEAGYIEEMKEDSYSFR